MTTISGIATSAISYNHPATFPVSPASHEQKMKLRVRKTQTSGAFATVSVCTELFSRQCRRGERPEYT
jgi:hypothetical protein